MHILLAEDEPELNALLTKRLSELGYAVDSCTSGTEALDFLACSEYDALLLDLMLPGTDGLNILSHLRTSLKKSTPVIFITARDSIEDRVAGLNAGADDYLVKPFAFEELLARLHVVVRRSRGISQNTIEVADLVMDLSAHTVARGGVQVDLSAKEFSVLECLMRHKGSVLSREQIGVSVWGYDYMGSSNMVDVYVRYLRRKLDDEHESKLIHTVRGIGYTIREP